MESNTIKMQLGTQDSLGPKGRKKVTEGFEVEVPS